MFSCFQLLPAGSSPPRLARIDCAHADECNDPQHTESSAYKHHLVIHVPTDQKRRYSPRGRLVLQNAQPPTHRSGMHVFCIRVHRATAVASSLTSGFLPLVASFIFEPPPLPLLPFSPAIVPPRLSSTPPSTCVDTLARRLLLSGGAVFVMGHRDILFMGCPVALRIRRSVPAVQAHSAPRDWGGRRESILVFGVATTMRAYGVVVSMCLVCSQGFAILPSEGPKKELRLRKSARFLLDYRGT